MNSERELDAATVALDRFGHSKQNTYAVLAGMTGAGASTIWYREHGRPSLRQKAITQQYLIRVVPARRKSRCAGTRLLLRKICLY